MNKRHSQVPSEGAGADNLSGTPPPTGGAVSNYILERKAVGGSYSQIATPTATTFPDTGRSPNTVYIYRLKASNANGSSAALETAGTTLIAAVCASGSSSDVNTKGCFGPVDDNWKVVPTHLAMLPDGRVIYWYSMDDVGLDRENTGVPHDKSRVFIWNPVTNTHTEVSAGLNTDLFCAGWSVLSDGRLFVAGGNLGDQWGSRNTNIFDPRTATWTAGPPMAKGRWYPTVTKLANGKLLITGGAYRDPNPPTGLAAGPLSSYNPDMELYTPDSGIGSISMLNTAMTFNATTIEPGDTRSPFGALTEGFYPWWFQATNGKAFLVGANTKSRYLDPSGSGSWSVSLADASAVTSEYRTYGSAVMYQPDKIMVMGGMYPATNTSYFVNLAAETPAFSGGPPFPEARTHLNATLLADGQVFVNGGNTATSSAVCGGPCSTGARWQATGATKKGLLLDPNAASPTFRDAALAARFRIYHSVAGLLPDGTVLTAGGGGCGICEDDGDPNNNYESHTGWDLEPDGSPASVVNSSGNSFTQSPIGRKTNQMNAEVYYPPYLFSGGSFRTRPTIQDLSGSGTDSYGNATIGYNTSFSLITPDAIDKVSIVALSATTHSFNMNQRFVDLSFSQSGNALTVSSPQSGSYAPPGYYLLFILKGGVPSISRIVRIS